MNAYSEFDYLMFTTISAGAREAAALFWSTSRFPPTFVFEDRDPFELESMLDPAGDWRDRTRTPFPATVVVKLDCSGIGGAQIWFEWPLDGEVRECFWPVMSD